MTITYPITLPDPPHPNQTRVTPVDAVAVSASPFTFGQEVQAHQGAMWRLSIGYPIMTRATAAPLIAALVSLRGQFGTFLFGDPLMAVPRGGVPGTPVVDGASQAGATLATRGWTPSATGVLLRGDMIQLGAGATSRLYMVLGDANADGAGKATLDIWPALRSGPADGATIATSNPVSVFRLAGNARPWEENLGDFFSIDIDAVEAL